MRTLLSATNHTFLSLRTKPLPVVRGTTHTLGDTEGGWRSLLPTEGSATFFAAVCGASSEAAVWPSRRVSNGCQEFLGLCRCGHVKVILCVGFTTNPSRSISHGVSVQLTDAAGRAAQSCCAVVLYCSPAALKGGVPFGYE